MLEVGERRYSNFQLQGFWFEKEIFYYGDYLDMKITCNRTEQLVVSACFTSADDYETQKENIIAMLNDYLVFHPNVQLKSCSTSLILYSYALYIKSIDYLLFFVISLRLISCLIC